MTIKKVRDTGAKHLVTVETMHCLDLRGFPILVLVNMRWALVIRGLDCWLWLVGAKTSGLDWVESGIDDWNWVELDLVEWDMELVDSGWP